MDFRIKGVRVVIEVGLRLLPGIWRGDVHCAGGEGMGQHGVEGDVVDALRVV